MSMKKTILMSLVGTMLAISTINAQKNVVSIRPINFLEGLYGLSYERTLLRNFSVGIYGDVGSNLAGPLNNFVTSTLGRAINSDSANTGITANNVTMKSWGWGIVPEARFYLSLAGAPKGFFLGVYAPIRQIKYEFTIDGRATFKSGSLSAARDASIVLKDERTFIGIGGMLGYHLVIAKLVSIEFMLGAAYNRGFNKEVELNYSAKDPSSLPTGLPSRGVEKQAVPALQTFTQILPRFGINLGIGF
jgi:hypothetical protein